MRAGRVLLTGATGFIGANLTRELVRLGAEVHVMLRGSASPWRLADVWPRLAVHRAELGDAAAVQAAVAAARPRVLFHLAMPSGHPRDRAERDAMLRTALLGTAHVLEAAAGVGVGRVVHLGSYLEYGPRAAPARESDPLEPVTARGAAKAAATLWCQGFARSSGTSAVALRVFSAYGPWEDDGRLVPTAVRAALRGEAMPLAAAAARRDFVYVDDVVAACLLAAQAAIQPGEAINVGTGVLSSSLDVVAAVEASSGRRVRIEGVCPPRPADASACAADIRRAREVLGWQPRHSLRQGVEAILAWARQGQGHHAPSGRPASASATGR